MRFPVRYLVTITIVFLFISANTIAQKNKPTLGSELAPLSVYDSVSLVNLPVLKMPNWLKESGTDLPEVTDNSQQIYWRPVFNQSGLSCGQASGIGLGFTYGINRMRGVPGDVPENQYPTHYTWNFGHGGNGWYGVSYFHSFEIVKTGGTPNVDVYGGMSAGGVERWMSGYDNYYHSMHNRISDVFKIDLTTVEGINTLRNWIHNHLDGSDVGGVANFYTNAPSASQTLPGGTPEAGKYVVTNWYSVNHGLTICGYHDSIRWDYNNDGQYTNDIDLNGDGEITPHDWEIGGFKFANTYSGGPTWANNGFCYMTYKSCADPYGNGGIWDNAAHVVYAKENTEPLLTAKATITYDCRDRIRIRVGASTDINAQNPDFILGFPIFNYQGGCQYMQGGTSVQANKTIELGLDITPFLNIIDPGTPTRYFLLIDENDPDGWGNGEVVSFSLMDYTNGVQEIPSSQSNVNIVADGQTKLWANHTLNYQEIEISTDTLPPATVYKPYSEQLMANGGTLPYIWEIDQNYTETNSSTAFPLINTEQLTPGNNDDGYAVKTLDFTFPFYENEITQVRVNVDGYISFEDMFWWKYKVYDFFDFTKNKLISPFQADLMLYSADGDGLWYSGDENMATFRWKASVNGYQSTSDLNFAVRLHKNGDIEFLYGNNTFSDVEWLSGLSAGNNKFYQFTGLSNDASVPYGYVCDFKKTRWPEGFEVSRDGILSGTPLDIYNNFPIKFRVTGENNLVDSKEVYFLTDGTNFLVIDSVGVDAGGDDVIGYGENVILTVFIKCLGDEPIYDANMIISNTDPYISLIDSSQFLGNFMAGETKSFTNAFSFIASTTIPDNHDFVLSTIINDGTSETWESQIPLTGFAPVLSSGSVYILDGGNGYLEPGETAGLQVSLLNEGGAEATNLLAELTISDPYLTINNGLAALSNLNANSSNDVLFNITASQYIPSGYELNFYVNITADYGISGSGNFNIIAGHLPILILDLDENNNSAPAIEATFNSIGILYEKQSSFPPDINVYPGIFVCLGIYSDNYVLSSSEGQELADFLTNGGKLYMEGGDTWAYDSQTAVHGMFNINGTDDGGADMSVVAGQPSTFTEGMSFNYGGDNSWMDHLEPIGPSILILENQSPVYGTAIAYDGGTYKTIGAAHEFGGLTDGSSPSTKEELMTAYLDFFGLLPPPVFEVNLTAFLEGPFNVTEMKTDLNTLGLLPVNQPYNIDPWFYDGPENVVSIPNSDIVDWFLVECRDAANAAAATPSTMFSRKVAFLLIDGSVVDMDGSSNLQFQYKINDNLFVVLWHRNHLGILSANPLQAFNDIYSYNFSTNANAVIGGSSAHKELAPGVWGMIAGDGNCDGQVSQEDISDIWSVFAGEALYHNGDYNLDGNIDNKDKDDQVIPNIGSAGQSLGD
ncbi:MAG: hypothetical protein K8S16_04180 [Bacteroidales bacterium]|nr:hypothetical protein [Bacteroidales bacterium]